MRNSRKTLKTHEKLFIKNEFHFIQVPISIILTTVFELARYIMKICRTIQMFFSFSQ
jgi:hypothetical protein